MRVDTISRTKKKETNALRIIYIYVTLLWRYMTLDAKCEKKKMIAKKKETTWHQRTIILNDIKSIVFRCTERLLSWKKEQKKASWPTNCTRYIFLRITYILIAFIRNDTIKNENYSVLSVSYCYTVKLTNKCNYLRLCRDLLFDPASLILVLNNSS